MPSSVDASAPTGTTPRPCVVSGPPCSSRFSFDRLTAITVAPARAAIAGTVVPMPPPPAPETPTMRPSRLMGLGYSCISRFVRTIYAVLLFGEYYSEAQTGLSRTISSRSQLLSGLELIDNVQLNRALPFRKRGPP